MGKTIVDETLKYTIIVNGDKGKKEMAQLEKSTKELAKANTDLEKKAKKLEKSRKDNREEIKKLRNEIEKNNKTIQGNEARMKELTKEIGLNNLSMRQLGREARKLNGIMSNLDPNTEEWQQYNKELKAVKTRMSDLRAEMKPVNDSLDDSMELWGGLTAAAGSFFIALSSGDAKAAKASLIAIVDLLKNAGKASLAFIATPIGAFIAVLAGIGLAAKEWFGFNEQAKEAIILTEQITGLQEEQARATRLQGQAIAKTFKVDFEETMKTAKVLVKQFGISYTEALAEIEQGLINGQGKNDEFFDSLREYPIFFAPAGFSVSEFRKTVEAGYDLGVYQDKLPDAIKEVDLSLREQTKSTVEALENAFGATFTKRILNQVKNGEITTKEALIEIAKEAEKTGLNVQQNAQLTADLFRGAGEDAGGAIVVLDAFNKALGDTEEALSPLEEMLKEVAQANQDLAKAQDEALRSDNYVALANDVELFWIKIKTAFFQGLKFITDQFQARNEQFTVFFISTIATLTQLPKIAKAQFSLLKKEVFDVMATFKGLGDVIQNVMALNFEGAKDAFQAFKEDFKAEANDVKNVATNTINGVLTARKAVADSVRAEFERRRQAAAQQRESENQGAGPRISIAGSGSGGDSELTAEDKKVLNSRKRLAELLDQFEAERAIKEQIKLLEGDKRAEEEEILRIEQKFKKLEEQANGETELLKRLEDEKLAQIQDVRKRFSDIRIERDKSEKEKLLEIQERFNDRLIKSESKLTIARKNAARQGLNIMRGFFGEASALSKALFVIQQGIAISDVVRSTAQAIAVATANEAKIPAFYPGPGFTIPNFLKPTSLAATAKSIAAAKTNMVTQIGIIGAETVEGFEEGLYPVKRNDGRVFRSRFGGEPTTQIVSAPTHFITGEVAPEMIIDGSTFKQMDPSVINYIMGLAGRATGFENGMYPQSATNDEVTKLLVGAVNTLNERLAFPIEANLYMGFEALQKQNEAQRKLDEVRNNAKIKKDAL